VPLSSAFATKGETSGANNSGSMPGGVWPKKGPSGISARATEHSINMLIDKKQNALWKSVMILFLHKKTFNLFQHTVHITLEYSTQTLPQADVQITFW
jgi:hypothetical protein